MLASVVMAIAVSAPSATAAPFDNHLTLVSVADPEVYLGVDAPSGGTGSSPTGISDDGRYVVFLSKQPHLVADPPASTGRYYYVRDIVAGTTTRVGRDIEGYYPGKAAISGNGRYIVYPSQDSASDQSVLRLFDRTTGTTLVISRSSTPVSAGIDWYTVDISDNGRSVVYTRANTIAGVAGGALMTRMYRYDVKTRATTEPVAGNLAGPSYIVTGAVIPSVSANGRYIAYSVPTGPGPGETPVELVRLDLTTGDRLVVVTSRPVYGGRVFGDPSLSNTGRFLAYYDLSPDGEWHVYLYDANKARSTLVTHAADGQPSKAGGSSVQVSGDGRYVTFISSGTDLVAGPPGGIWMSYMWDRSTGTIEALVRNLRGSYPRSYTAGTSAGYLDGDGSTMAFASTAADLVPGADNRLERVYAWHR